MDRVFPDHLIIRADANPRMGAGHALRCLALAQEWLAQGGQVIFVTGSERSALHKRLSDEGCQVMTATRIHPHPSDWLMLAELLSAHQDAVVVLDGYHFSPLYQKKIKDSGHRLLVIDDMAHLEHYYADVLLNQNIHAGRLRYSCEPGTRLLLGTQYVLLRNEFMGWRNWHRGFPEVGRKVLVTLGGGDQDNVTLKVIEALRQVDNPGLEAVVVVGPLNPHLSALQDAARGIPHEIRFTQDATDMAHLMAWADVAVAAAGSSCWELCLLGVPALLLVLAENQRPVAEGVAGAGAAINLGWHNSLQPAGIASALQELLPAAARRRQLSEQGRKLVDGGGRKAVVQHLRAEKLTLRAVRDEDCRLLWDWVNDTDVRKASFQSTAVSWGDHAAWFSSKSSDSDCVHYLAVKDDGTPIGQIRFDLKGDEAVVGVSIGAGHRGKGYGLQIIESGVRTLFASTRKIGVVHAYIKKDNDTSLNAFMKAGFSSCGEESDRDGVRCVHLARRRDS